MLNIAAAPIPCSMRDTSSSSNERDSAHASEAKVNTARPPI